MDMTVGGRGGETERREEKSSFCLPPPHYPSAGDSILFYTMFPEPMSHHCVRGQSHWDPLQVPQLALPKACLHANSLVSQKK